MSKQFSEPPLDEEDQLLDLLYQLYFRLHNHQGAPSTDSLLTKYNYFIEHSSAGRNCTYAQKSKHLFFKYDWEEVRRILLLLQDKLKV